MGRRTPAADTEVAELREQLQQLEVELALHSRLLAGLLARIVSQN